MREWLPVMIVIPVGKFTMGSPENEPDRQTSEGPQHEVTLLHYCDGNEERGANL